MYTPYVAATSFFAGEVEIFDFVTERVKKYAYTIVKAEYFYEWEYNYLCIDTHTPQVAATSFFIHRTEIFDFVVR